MCTPPLFLQPSWVCPGKKQRLDRFGHFTIVVIYYYYTILARYKQWSCVCAHLSQVAVLSKRLIVWLNIHKLCEITGKSLMHVCDRYWRMKTEHQMPTNFCWTCKMLLPGGRGTNRIQKSYVLLLPGHFLPCSKLMCCYVLSVRPFLRPIRHYVVVSSVTMHGHMTMHH